MPLQSVDFSIFSLNLVIPNIHLCLHAIVMYNIWIPYYLLDNMGIKQLKHCLGTIATITCTGVLSTHAWGYPCTYPQCLQLSLQTADFSSPVPNITLLSLELDGFSSHFCLQSSLVLLTMPRSNMHVSSHLRNYPIHRFPTLSVCISLHCLLISASLSWITSVCCWICSVCCWICSVCCWIWASFCWSWVFLCWSWPFLCSSLPLLSYLL